MISRSFGWVLIVTLSLALAGCGNRNKEDGETKPRPTPAAEEERETIWDLFNQPDTSTQVRVNRFIWNATLEVFNFMPIKEIDPFTGVVEYGWGTPPGGSTEYSATVVVRDPALAARALQLTLRTRSGLADPVTTKEVENAILSRARQLRVEELGY